MMAVGTFAQRRSHHSIDPLRSRSRGSWMAWLLTRGLRMLLRGTSQPRNPARFRGRKLVLQMANPGFKRLNPLILFLDAGF